MHLLRKKVELGVIEQEEPQLAQSFPKEGYKADLKGLPNISFGTVWRFMIEGVESKKQLSTAKPLVKGFNFFKSGHVLYIGYLHESGKHYIKSQVLPSMKKDKVYTCFLVIHLIPKWRPINYSFVCMLISPLGLVIMNKKQKNFEVKMRQRGLINMQTKE